MNKIITPILLVVVAIGLFFSYLKPAFSNLRASQGRLEAIEKTINESDGLLKNYQDLRTRLSTISQEDKKNLYKILPEVMDPVRMIIDLDNLATKNGLKITSFELPEIRSEFERKNGNSTKKQTSTGSGESASDPVGKGVLGIECEGKYEQFKLFMSEIEQSMALMDVVNLYMQGVDVTQADEKPRDPDTMMFNVGLQTYWLKRTE